MIIEPIKVVKIVKFIGLLTSTWPLKPNSKKIFKTIKHSLWIISFLNVIGLLLPLLLGVYHFSYEPVLMMKALSELTALGDVFFNLIICKLHENRLHMLLTEVYEYSKLENGKGRSIFRDNINRYLPFCVFVGLSYFQTAIAFSCGPIFMSQQLPADTWYPFYIEQFTTKYFIVYIQQVVAIIQTGSFIIVDFMVAILLCYSSTKLQILNSQLEKVDNNFTLNKCIRQHQQCINYSQQLSRVVRFTVLKSNATMAMAVIFGAFPILYNKSLPVISQFILMVVGGCLRLYVSAWPADDLREMSEKVSWSIYNSYWIGSSKKMQKSIEIMIRRGYKPLVITIVGILPALTLQFYAAFLSSTLSYFMTLRAVLAKE